MPLSCSDDLRSECQGQVLITVLYSSDKLCESGRKLQSAQSCILTAVCLLQGRPSLEFVNSLDISAHQGQGRIGFPIFIHSCVLHKGDPEKRGTLHILSVVFRTTLTLIPKYYLLKDS